MNKGTSWTLVAIALGLFAFIYFFERHLRVGPEPPGPLLPRFDLATVTSVQVQPPAQKLIRVERTNGGWRLTQPLDYAVESERVENLLKVLGMLTRQRQIASPDLRDRENATGEFGFGSPESFSVFIEQGNRRDQLLVGNKTRNGDAVYLQLVGTEAIFLADAQILQFFPRSADDWRDRTVVSLKNLTMDRLGVTNGARAMAFQRDSATKPWRMTHPRPTRADSPLIEHALSELEALQIAQFVTDDPAADLGAYGLRPPALDLVLAQGTNVLASFSVGGSPSNDFSQLYLRRHDPPGVVLVASNALAPWFLNYQELRDHQLVSFGAGVIHKVEVLGDGEFTLEQQSNNVWRVTSPENFAADPDLVNLLFGLLNGLRISDFAQDVVEDAELDGRGLQNPTRRYILSTTTNLFARLDFGVVSNEVEKVYARRGGEDPIYALKRTDYDGLPAGGWQLRDRRIWSFSTNEVARITVRHKGKVNQFIRNPAGNWAVGAATTGDTNHTDLAFIETAVNDSLGQLSVSQHGTWRARGAESRAKYGITDDSLKLEIELRRGDQPQTLSVELSDPSADPHGATTLDGVVWVFDTPSIFHLIVSRFMDPAPEPP